MNGALQIVDPDPRAGITLRRIETIETLKDAIPKEDILNLLGKYLELPVVSGEFRFGLISSRKHRTY